MYPQNSEENITVPENGNTSSEDTVDDTATGADHGDEEGEMGMYAVVDDDQFFENRKYFEQADSVNCDEYNVIIATDSMSVCQEFVAM